MGQPPRAATCPDASSAVAVVCDAVCPARKAMRGRAYNYLPLSLTVPALAGTEAAAGRAARRCRCVSPWFALTASTGLSARGRAGDGEPDSSATRLTATLTAIFPLREKPARSCSITETAP